MECVSKRTNDVLHVSMSGKCTFSDYVFFKDIIDACEKDAVKRIDINMSGLEYVDSSGLGMLLMLKEKIASKAAIQIISPQGQVKKMIDVAKLGNIFTVVA